jgi:16S rRNA (cytosine1402-N4)-methyltransferase
MTTKKPLHTSVMTTEFLNGFEGISIKNFFDGTLGAGGHAKAILQTHPEIERYFGCDVDPEALEIAKTTLKDFGNVEFIKKNFADLDEILQEREVGGIDCFFLT